MFQNLKENRNFVMGIAMVGIAIFHMPLDISWLPLNIVQDMLYLGVDMFLFISGIGACHSIGRRGKRSYIHQRAKRMLPSLVPVLFVWGLCMLLLGGLTVWEFFGNLTLLGWYVGQGPQLNWYFSAVWIFFLLALPMYRPMVEGKHPVPVMLAVSAFSVVLLLLTPFPLHPMALSRVPMFLLGMLFGRMELQGRELGTPARALLYTLLPVGILLLILVFFNWNNYGSSMGLWWYPLILVAPGAVFLAADIGALLRRNAILKRVLLPFEAIGEASPEALMIHGGIYKIIDHCTKLYPWQWVVVMILGLTLGVLYYRRVAKPYLLPIKPYNFINSHRTKSPSPGGRGTITK